MREMKHIISVVLIVIYLFIYFIIQSSHSTDAVTCVRLIRVCIRSWFLMNTWWCSFDPELILLCGYRRDSGLLLGFESLQKRTPVFTRPSVKFFFILFFF